MELSAPILTLSDELLGVLFEDLVLHVNIKNIVTAKNVATAIHHIETPDQLAINSKEGCIRFEDIDIPHAMSSMHVLKHVSKWKELKLVCKRLLAILKQTKLQLPFIHHSYKPSSLSVYHFLKVTMDEPPGASSVMRFCVEYNLANFLKKYALLSPGDRVSRDVFVNMCLAKTVARILQSEEKASNPNSRALAMDDWGGMLGPFGGEGAVFGTGRGCWWDIMKCEQRPGYRRYISKEVLVKHARSQESSPHPVYSYDGVFWHVSEDLLLDTLRNDPVLALVFFGTNKGCLRFTDSSTSKEIRIDKNREQFKDRFHRYLANSKQRTLCHVLRLTHCTVAPGRGSMERMAYSNVLLHALGRIESAACYSRLTHLEPGNIHGGGIEQDDSGVEEGDDVVSIGFSTDTYALSKPHVNGPLWSAVQSSLGTLLSILITQSHPVRWYYFSSMKFSTWLRWTDIDYKGIPLMNMAHEKISEKYMNRLTDKDDGELTYAQIQGVYDEMYAERTRLLGFGHEGLKWTKKKIA